MNNYEAASLIEEILPEAHIFEKTGRITFDINKTISCLTDFLRNKILIHDMVSVKKALNVAEIIYNKGNNAVRTAIENILVYSLSSIIPQGKLQRREFQSTIPATLYSLYVHQIMHSTM
jgi:hypothetical protein